MELSSGLHLYWRMWKWHGRAVTPKIPTHKSAKYEGPSLHLTVLSNQTHCLATLATLNTAAVFELRTRSWRSTHKPSLLREHKKRRLIYNRVAHTPGQIIRRGCSRQHERLQKGHVSECTVHETTRKKGGRPTYARQPDALSLSTKTIVFPSFYDPPMQLEKSD